MLQTDFENIDKVKQDKRLGDLIERVCFASKTGRELIQDAISRGIDFQMSDEIGSASGAFRAKENRIYLNQHCSDNELLTVLVHEARHSQQNIFAYEKENSFYSAVAITRAKEADATAYQCQAAFEMATLEYEAFEDMVLIKPEIMNPFLESVRKNEGVDKARSVAFEHWYDSDLSRDAYDQRVLTCLQYGDIQGKKMISGKQLSSQIAPYINADFFCQKNACKMSQEIIDKANEIEKKNVGICSADRFYAVQKDGSIKPPKDYSSIINLNTLKSIRSM
ncbi:MAG: hypothetical protein MJ250_01040 [Alphaproteobacteria bacterium]|nr:hypothetical protein [Alphaproteobacteria bacterium]